MLAMLPALASAQSPPIQIQWTVPTDITGGAPKADLTQAAVFAWQEFIALNWPAAAGTRDTPDTAQRFGQNGTAGGSPLVWETQRAKVEIFPGNANENAGPHGAIISQQQATNGPLYGYNDAPAYIYNHNNTGTSDGSIAACPGQAPPAQPAWINLDEVTQIGLDSISAGVLPSSVGGGNTKPQLIRFMAKANSTQYAYVVAHQYWYNNRTAPLHKAQTNFTNAVQGQPLATPYVFFPAGTIETKAAWRPLGPNDNPAHFHTARVRFYEMAANGHACYFEAQWALIALHIIQKTPSAPAFIFATFEQSENIVVPDPKTKQAVQVEDANGQVIAPQPNPTVPAQSYADSPTSPRVSIVGSTYCTPQQQLFYHEASVNSGVPTAGNICVAQRYHNIPPPIIAVNASAHAAIAQYTSANKVPNSPWAYYKLVNVQAQPFDKSQIVSDPTSKYNVATYYQANGVVETDYTLQNFSGGQPVYGAPSDYNRSTTPPQLGIKNVYLFPPKVTTAQSFNMGGCMGCHGVAQSIQGTDFSFILGESGTIRSPETGAAALSKELTQRYQALFVHP
jgi:hypothetical protein